MRILWISLWACLIIASVDAQRKFNSSRPVVSLETRTQPSIWHRPPEERRKLSIFPKNNMKFIVTPKTVIKNDEAATITSTKKPLMRKFIVRDKNEKGSWYFAPREPLMKTKIFTVTVPPQRISARNNSRNFNIRDNDEIADESQKIKTVINNYKKEQDFNKGQINKGNLINVAQNKVNVTTPKISEHDKVVKEETLNQQSNDVIQNNDTFKEIVLKSVPDYYVINTQSQNSTEANDNITESIDENKNKSETVTKSPPSNLEEILSETVENRSLDLNELEIIDQSETFNLNLNNKSFDKKMNNSIDLNTPGLLLKNERDDTEDLSVVIDAYIDTNILTQETNETIDAKPKEINTQLNHFYKVGSFEYVKEKTKSSNMKGIGSATEVLEIFDGDDTHNTNVFGETENINIRHNLHENITDSLGNTEFNSLIDLIKGYSDDKINDTTIETISNGQNENSSNERIFNMDIVEEYTDDPMMIVSTTQSQLQMTTYQPIVQEEDLNGDFQTYSPREFLVDYFESQSTEKIIIEINTPDTLNSDEILKKESVVESSSEISDKSMTDLVNFTNEALDVAIIDESKNSKKEILFGLLIDKSNNYTGGKASNEPLVDKSDKLSGDKESLYKSNMAGKDMSNELISEKLSYLTEETSNESLIDRSNNYTSEYVSNGIKIDKLNNFGKDFSNKSNIAGKEISNVYISDQSNIVTQESSDELLIDTSNNYTAEEVSNESVNDKPSYLSSEEISNESISNKSNDLTQETSDESLIDTSNNYTGEEVSNEFVIDKSNHLSATDKFNHLSGEEMSYESISDTSNNLTQETSDESLIDTSNNYTGEEVSNESIIDKSNNLTGEEISYETNTGGEELSIELMDSTSNDSAQDISNESLIDSSANSTGKKISDESLVDKSNNLSGEVISNEFIKESQHMSPKYFFRMARRNRFKRSNNIIEEENPGTTLSGFRYTDLETRLEHDLSYKNINA